MPKDLHVLIEANIRTGRYKEAMNNIKELISLIKEPDDSEREAIINGIEKYVLYYKLAMMMLKRANDEIQVKNPILLCVLTAYHMKVWNQAKAMTAEAMEVIDAILAKAVTPYNIIAFSLLKAETYKFQSDFALENKSELVSKAYYWYMKASDYEKYAIMYYYPIPLQVAYSLGIFNYASLGRCEQGYRLLYDTFNKAIPQLECMDDELYKAVTVILQQMRDALILWADELRNDLDYEARYASFITE